MRKWILALLIGAAGSAAAAEYRIEPVADGLDYPFAILPLPSGEILVTEKPGRIRIIRDGKLLAASVSGTPKVLWQGEYAGLQDLAMHPHFAENKLLYMSFVQGTRDANAVHIARGRYENGHLSEVTDIFSVSPTKATLNHPAARLAFVKDGTLLMTVGDGFEYREQAQNRESMLGKVIRITDEGAIPEDNPFVDASGRRSAIWTLGHRHQQGLLYDAVEDRVYEHEHGPQGGDEINLIERGKNYGWPIATYGIAYSGAYVSPYQEYPGTQHPILHWTPSIAPCGFTQCRNCQWPEWEGDLFVGMLGGQHVRRVRLSEGAPPQQEMLFEEMQARIRDVRFGPDGALYVLQDETGKLVKVVRGILGR